MRKRTSLSAFTLIELLVVVAVIGLLISILLPSLSNAREAAKGAKCLSNLRVLGQGLVMYTSEYRDVLVPGRLPKLPGTNCDPYADILGGRKYRPTFTAMTSLAVGVPPFQDPQACKNRTDKFGEPGDKQNFDYEVYVCPSAADWTDERNGAYGYNYQFLGNSRVFDDTKPDSYKNWPVRSGQIRLPAQTVAVADCMGTAASSPPAQRKEYENNGSGDALFGNEGFTLAPPRIDEADGEAAGWTEGDIVRTAVHPRHRENGNVLWVDGHASGETLESLGYQFEPDGSVGVKGDNRFWSGNGLDVGWTPEFEPTW
jgi:prepilin-type N-terminal cleavage/methylation domain-containing protein/prepilin-type processing-associated H-X9-DG protein